VDTTVKLTSPASKRRPTALRAGGEKVDAAVAQEDRIIRERECRRITGLSRSTRWRLERVGKFPRRRQISPGCSGWLLSEVRGWVASR
jgi:prophage regulatory protein